MRYAIEIEVTQDDDGADDAARWVLTAFNEEHGTSAWLVSVDHMTDADHREKHWAEFYHCTIEVERELTQDEQDELCVLEDDE